MTLKSSAAAVAIESGELTLGGGLLALVRPALDLLEPGGVLAILSRSPSARQDLPSWCRAERHEYGGCEPVSEGVDRHLIVRGGFPFLRGDVRKGLPSRGATTGRAARP